MGIELSLTLNDIKKHNTHMTLTQEFGFTRISPEEYMYENCTLLFEDPNTLPDLDKEYLNHLNQLCTLYKKMKPIHDYIIQGIIMVGGIDTSTPGLAVHPTSVTYLIKKEQDSLLSQSSPRPVCKINFTEEKYTILETKETATILTSLTVECLNSNYSTNHIIKMLSKLSPILSGAMTAQGIIEFVTSLLRDINGKELNFKYSVKLPGIVSFLEIPIYQGSKPELIIQVIKPEEYAGRIKIQMPLPEMTPNTGLVLYDLYKEELKKQGY